MRFFAAETFGLVLRRWQTTLFLLLIFSPALTPLNMLLHMLGLPVLIIVEPGHIKKSIALWLLVLLIAMSWSALQIRALSGGSAWSYIARLLSARQLMLLNLMVLLIVDLPLLLPFIGAEITLLRQGDLSSIPRITAIAILAMQLPVFQLLFQQAFPGLVLCVFADLVGMWAMAIDLSIWFLSLAVVLGSLISLVYSIRYRKIKLSQHIQPCSYLRLSAERSPSLNILIINFRYLYSRLNLWRYLGGLFYITLPVLMIELLRKQDVQSLILMIIADLSLIPLVHNIAGLVFDLHRLHNPMYALHAIYHAGATGLKTLTFITLQAIFCILCLPIVVVLYQQCLSWYAIAVMPIAMMILFIFMIINYRRINKRNKPE
ncbi:hypothetical protein [Methylomonas sp. AM2-LC]|uniref:hypothetical protein n=1 Tax=Methylomonas sp. AM2-LC TaxID=3153301 RepID=UPI0032664274